MKYRICPKLRHFLKTFTIEELAKTGDDVLVFRQFLLLFLCQTGGGKLSRPSLPREEAKVKPATLTLQVAIQDESQREASSRLEMLFNASPETLLFTAGPTPPPHPDSSEVVCLSCLLSDPDLHLQRNPSPKFKRGTTGYFSAKESEGKPGESKGQEMEFTVQTSVLSGACLLRIKSDCNPDFVLDARWYWPHWGPSNPTGMKDKDKVLPGRFMLKVAKSSAFCLMNCCGGWRGGEEGGSLAGPSCPLIQIYAKSWRNVP